MEINLNGFDAFLKNKIRPNIKNNMIVTFKFYLSDISKIVIPQVIV